MADIKKNKDLLDTIKPTRQSSHTDDETSTIKVTPRKDKDGVIRPVGSTTKLKRPAPKPQKPANWRDSSIADATDSPLSGIDSPAEGPSNGQNEDSSQNAAKCDTQDVQTCKFCKKQFPKASMKSHIGSCPSRENKKKTPKDKPKAGDKDKEKLTPKPKEKGKEREKKTAQGEDVRDGEDDEDEAGDDEQPTSKIATPLPGGIKSAKKSTAKKSDVVDGDKKGKKRKADGDAEKAPKPKKKKEEPKPKAPKPKGPVDVERQCGVITPNGVPCARSLTCKSHSMGAKRAVPGRSMPYDMLLSAYQKKNQAKQQKAAIDANAPLEDEEEANAGPVDTDEERDAVMGAFLHFGAVPFVPQPVLEPILKKYQRQRLKEELNIATRGGTVNIFAVKSRGGVALPLENDLDAEDAPGDVDYGVMGSRRGSTVLPPQPQRRASSIVSVR